ITNERGNIILEYFLERLKNIKKKSFIITPNPEMLVYAHKDLAYQSKLNCADIALADGIGLFFAGSLMGEQLKERITGVDFIEKLCEMSREKPISMGFLGGRAGIAERTAECLLKKYPYLDIVFAGADWNDHGFDFKLRHTESKMKEEKLKKQIKKVITIDILFVAYGVPKQEEWIYKNLQKLPVKAAMGVGGSFDFLSGTVRRAPFIIRYAGLEWLFRLIVQPWRWKRQLALIEFIFFVFKDYFAKPSA
ncbi:MAG TPA: WecB/TagA/CpsF family glycosyltransferase, partial [Candidatus Sulfotelmatobacter sp.]|nr:WecB/TagA/CpsF family glycosyltransferase [Candidatus Sulfotelmatobacter sp.]